MASYERRQSLLKLLNRIQIPTNITPEALVRMIGLVQSSVAIMFTNKDLPHQGHRHLHALHITFDTIEKMVLMVLINNGSALIACPLKTTSCLGIKGSRIVVLRAKYKVDSKWLLARPAKAASFTWRGLESVRHVLAKGACMLVGSGQNILVWRDPWIPDLNNFLPQPRDTYCTQQSMAVVDLMSQDKLGWDVGKLNVLFNEVIVQAIKNIPC